MPSRALESATADLFAAVPRPAVAPAVPDPLPGRRVRSRAQPLWYAAVFPQLETSRAAATLERLCLHAQRFTPRVSIEMPNALLLEIRGSVKLFGSLETLHTGIIYSARPRPRRLPRRWPPCGWRVPAGVSSSRTPACSRAGWRSCRLAVPPGAASACRHYVPSG
jgi:hypothetical protein